MAGFEPTVGIEAPRWLLCADLGAEKENRGSALKFQNRGNSWFTRLTEAMLEPRRGFEPPAYGLQNHCSTIELSRQLARQTKPLLDHLSYMSQGDGGQTYC